MHHARGTTFQATATMEKRFSLTNANDLFRADTSLSIDDSRLAHLSVIIKNPASEIVKKRTPTVFIQLNTSALIEFFTIQAQRLVEGGVYFKITFSYQVLTSILRASLCKILISSFANKMDFAHNFSVHFF